MLAGCGVGPTGVEADTASSALVTGNGHMQNGHMQNGHMQNGELENGVELALVGVDLTTMKRLLVVPPPGQNPNLSASNLVAIPNVRLDRGLLTDGVQSASAFAGTIVSGTLSNGLQNVPVYIEAVTATADAELPHYTLKAYHRFIPATKGQCDRLCPMIWDYVCGTISAIGICRRCPPSTVPTTAIAVGGQWDYHSGQAGDGRKLIEAGAAGYDTQVTFACTNGAIGKCVEKAHYKPWAQAAPECRVVTTTGILECWNETEEMLHESCVRMVRADYCGNGQSMTVDGIGIDLWDHSNIDTEAEQVWGKEAEWTPNGARCLDVANMGRTAHMLNGELLGEYLSTTCPGKWNGQVNQGSIPFRWEDNDCFGHGTASQHSTYYTENLPLDPTYHQLTSMDMHDRVWIMNRSMCVYVDGAPDMGNPDATNPLCF